MSNVDISKEAAFTEWFRKNYPGPDAIIHNPDWHAPKIYRAATHDLIARIADLEGALEAAQGDYEDAEAVIRATTRRVENAVKRREKSWQKLRADLDASRSETATARSDALREAADAVAVWHPNIDGVPKKLHDSEASLTILALIKEPTT